MLRKLESSTGAVADWPAAGALSLSPRTDDDDLDDEAEDDDLEDDDLDEDDEFDDEDDLDLDDDEDDEDDEDEDEDEDGDGDGDADAGGDAGLAGAALPGAAVAPSSISAKSRPIRPRIGLSGRPLPVSFVHALPPLVVFQMPLPGPPPLKPHGWRRR